MFFLYIKRPKKPNPPLQLNRFFLQNHKLASTFPFFTSFYPSKRFFISRTIRAYVPVCNSSACAELITQTMVQQAALYTHHGGWVSLHPPAAAVFHRLWTKYNWPNVGTTFLTMPRWLSPKDCDSAARISQKQESGCCTKSFSNG